MAAAAPHQHQRSSFWSWGGLSRPWERTQSPPVVTNSCIWQLSHTMMKVCSAFSRLVGRNKTWGTDALPCYLPLKGFHPLPSFSSHTHSSLCSSLFTPLSSQPIVHLKPGVSAEAPPQCNAGIQRESPETEIQKWLLDDNMVTS